MKQSLIPAFFERAKDLNFEFVAVCDIWHRRRDEGADYIKKVSGFTVEPVVNTDAFYARKDVDAVLIAIIDNPAKPGYAPTGTPVATAYSRQPARPQHLPP